MAARRRPASGPTDQRRSRTFLIDLFVLASPRNPRRGPFGESVGQRVCRGSRGVARGAVIVVAGEAERRRSGDKARTIGRVDRWRIWILIWPDKVRCVVGVYWA